MQQKNIETYSAFKRMLKILLHGKPGFKPQPPNRNAVSLQICEKMMWHKSE